MQFGDTFLGFEKGIKGPKLNRFQDVVGGAVERLQGLSHEKPTFRELAVVFLKNRQIDN